LIRMPRVGRRRGFRRPTSIGRPRGIRREPTLRQKITNELIKTTDRATRSRIETRRNRLTGELENTIIGRPSETAIRIHHDTLVAKWAYRKSEAEFVADLLRPVRIPKP